MPTLTCAWDGAAAAKAKTASNAKYLKYFMVISLLGPNYASYRLGPKCLQVTHSF